MTRPETTKMLSGLVEDLINPKKDSRIYWAREVTFDYATSSPIRVDYMMFRPENNTVGGIEHGDFYCYEIKSSAADFHSKHGHNFIGEYNYYVMPKDVFDAVRHDIPFNVGVYVPSTDGTYLIPIKFSRRTSRKRPVSEMLLMMFRSCARELRKVNKK